MPLAARHPAPADRLRKLLDAATRLARARTPAEVAATMAHIGRLDAGDGGTTLFELDETARILRVVATHARPELPDAFAVVPLDGAMPLARSVQALEPVLFDAAQDGWDALDPVVREAMEGRGLTAYACLPLVVDGRATGALSLSYHTAPPYDEEGRVFLRALASQCAVALDRARTLHAQARTAAWTAATTDAVMAVLEASDAQAGLRQAARAALPTLADWVSVYLVEHGEPRFSFAVHSDPALETHADEVKRRFPVDPLQPAGPAMVARSGRAETYTHVRHEQVVRYARSPEEAGLLSRVPTGSVTIVPLTHDGQTFGSMAFSHSDMGFYGAGDEALALTFATRLAAALQSAMAHRARLQFLSVAAHEIGNPLVPLRSWAELYRLAVARPGSAPPKPDVLERGLARVARLVDDLRDTAGIEAGRFGMRRAPCDVAEILAAVAEAHRPEYEAAGVRLRLDVPPGAIPAFADATRLEQVVENLLANAVKFTPRDGHVVLKARVANRFVRIEVQDEGLGMEREAMARLFQPFVRLQSQSRGLGLGLYLCKGIVELHGGRIWATSPGQGRGSTFTVLIPVQSPGTEDEVDLGAPGRNHGSEPNPGARGLHT